MQGETTPLDTVEVALTEQAFDALEAPWRALHDASDSSVFQSFEWTRAWWRYFAGLIDGSSLYVMSVRDEAGALIAIAPMFQSGARVLGVLPLRSLQWIGVKNTDYLDLLAASGLETRAYAAIAAHIAGHARCDVLSLNDIPDDSGTHVGFIDALRSAGYAPEASLGARCPRLVLMPTWHETLAAMKPSHAKRVLYIDRKLRKNFDVKVETATRETVDADLDEFIGLHNARWAAPDEGGALRTGASRAFHQEVARAFAERGWLALSFLVLDGKRVAASYSFKRKGVLGFYLSGALADEDARRFATGILLHVYSIQALIEEGGTVYDFLRGEDRYKYELGAVDKQNRSFQLIRTGRPWVKPLRIAQRAQDRALRELKRRLKAA